MPGGGIRGLFTATALDLILARAGLTVSDIDLFIGTSIGAIQSVAYADGKTPTFMRDLFIDKGEYIFSVYDHPEQHDTSWYDIASIITAITSNPLSAIEGAISALVKTQIGEKASHQVSIMFDDEKIGNTDYIAAKSFYLSKHLEEVITDVIGNKKLSDIQKEFVVTAYNATKHDSALLSNIAGMDGYLEGKDMLAKDAILASSAAYPYLPEHIVNGERYIDGGFIVNDPVLEGYVVARRKYPTASKISVLTVGTCTPYPQETLKGFASVIPTPLQKVLYNLTHVTMGGAAQLNNKTMQFIADDLYTNYHAYYFDYQFKETDAYNDAPMDNTETAYLQKLQDAANERFNADLPKLDNFLQHMTAS